MDARSLLRAKKAEARIEHPYAAYSAAGQLRCSICAMPVKQWDAHLLTKQHRQSVIREKQSQAKAKRPATESLAPESKRSKVETTSQQTETANEEEEGAAPNGLPAGFFSAGNQPTVQDEDEDEDEEDGQAGPSRPTVSQPAVPVAPAPTGDLELDDFLSSLAEPESQPVAAAAPTKQPAKRYLSDNGPAGVASYEAAPVRILTKEQEEAETEEQEPEETDEERRKRIEREEKEEIMGRLEDEERAQEDADSRVVALKARMEMLKKRREARPAKQKTKKGEEVNGA